MQIITVKKFLLENIDTTLNNPNKYITNIYRRLGPMNNTPPEPKPLAVETVTSTVSGA